MGKGKLFTFTLFATLGAIAGYASYMISKDEFSDETIDRYDKVVNKLKNVGTDIKRTYTSIGDKKEFTNSSKNLSESAMKLAAKTGDLIASASVDMYESAKDKIMNAIDSNREDDDEFDDLIINNKKNRKTLELKNKVSNKINKKVTNKKKKAK